MPNLPETRILILATDGFEQSELETPLNNLRTAGATVHVCAPSQTREEGLIRGWNGGDWGTTVPVDVILESSTDWPYHALVLPGGVINPDQLRANPHAIQLVQAFVREGKPVAAICHGPWLLAEAGVVKGRKLTSYKSIKTDMVNAGADWQDEEVVTDNGLITSRQPSDLKAFVAKILEEVREGPHSRAA